MKTTLSLLIATLLLVQGLNAQQCNANDFVVSNGQETLLKISSTKEVHACGVNICDQLSSGIQTLSLSSDEKEIAISNGNSISLPDNSATNELQQLTTDGSRIYLSQGGSIATDSLQCNATSVCDALLRTTKLTAWQSFAPVTSWSAYATAVGSWRRVADSMEVKLQLTVLSGTGLSFTFDPNIAGYTADTTKMLLGVGQCLGSQTGVGFWQGAAYYQPGAANPIRCGGPAGHGAWGSNVPWAWKGGDILTVLFSLPIVGWTYP